MGVIGWLVILFWAIYLFRILGLAPWQIQRRRYAEAKADARQLMAAVEVIEKRTQCAHAGAVPVTLDNKYASGELVAYWCAACGTQLDPEKWQPPSKQELVKAVKWGAAQEPTVGLFDEGIYIFDDVLIQSLILDKHHRPLGKKR